MSLSLRALTLAGLSYIRPSGPGTSEATITNASSAQLARISADISAVLQELYEQAPALYRRTLAATLAAPQTVTITTTDGSTTVTTGSSFTDGATVLILGVYNQIYTETVGVTVTKKLLFPATATGAQTATLYGDVVALDSTVAEILDEVFLATGRKLNPRNNKTDLLTSHKQYPDYGRNYGGTAGLPFAGAPDRYWVENCMTTGADTGHASTLRLRVMPLPSTQQQISYLARLRAPSFVAADLGTDSADSTKSLVVANDYVESLVRPLFLKRWAGSPWFKDDVAIKQIEEDAARARQRIQDFSPQQKRNRRITAPL